MFGIDQQVQQTADAYRGKPQMLQQKYAQNQQLIDLLALQKLKSDKEEASRQMTLQMGGQGTPPTIADQRESQVMDLTKQEVVQEQTGVMQQKLQQQQAAQQKIMQAAGAPQQQPAQGLAGLPAPNIQGMAGGGIVAFYDGGSSDKESAGEKEALAAYEQQKLQQQQRAEQPARAPQAQGNFQSAIARLQTIDPETVRKQQRDEATTAANYTPAERATKQRHIDERTASYDTNKLARMLMGMGGYSSPALAIQGGGATAVNDADQAMRDRQRGEGQFVDMGVASRIAGSKAGEIAYGHAMPGLTSGVNAGVNLAQIADSGANRAESARVRADTAATLDERNRLKAAEDSFDKNKKIILKSMEDKGILPGTPESIPYYDQVNAIGKTIYERQQVGGFFAPDPVPSKPVEPPAGSGFWSGVGDVAKGIAGLNPKRPTVDFAQMQRRNQQP